MNKEVIYKDEVLKLIEASGGAGAEDPFDKGIDYNASILYGEVESMAPVTMAEIVADRIGFEISDEDLDDFLSDCEKMLPIRPITNKYYYFCPKCGCARSIRQIHKYCHDCGQKLEWSMEK